MDSVFSRALIGYLISEYPVLFTDSPPVPLSERRQTHFFLKVNFQITDLSKGGLPPVKVFIPDSMPQATVQ